MRLMHITKVSTMKAFITRSYYYALLLINTIVQKCINLYLTFKYYHAMKELKEKFQALLTKYNINLSVVEAEQTTETVEPVKVEQAAKASLENGTEVFTDSDAWAVGVRIYSVGADGADVPLADGEYVLADGTKIVVADGVVSEMEAPTADTTEEQPMDMTAELNAVLTVVANLEKKVAELTALNTQLSASLEEAKVKLSATPAAASVTEAPVKVEQSKQNTNKKPLGKMSPAERVMHNLLNKN